MNELVTMVNGIPTANSKDVAEYFEKQHKHVLDSIRNLIAENSAVKSMMFENTYEQRGKEYIQYDLTRDGFSLLVMGFTGSKALEWKLKYIEAFNKMESSLQNKLKDSYMIEDPVDRAKRWIEEQQYTQQLKTENRLLIGENLKWADRNFINAAVRQYAGYACDGSFGAAWVDFKKEILYKHSINLNSRITKYLNESGKKTKPKTLDMLDDSEVPNAVSTIVSMCRDKNVDISELITKLSTTGVTE